MFVQIKSWEEKYAKAKTQNRDLRDENTKLTELVESLEAALRKVSY